MWRSSLRWRRAKRKHAEVRSHDPSLITTAWQEIVLVFLVVVHAELTKPVEPSSSGSYCRSAQSRQSDHAKKVGSILWPDLAEAAGACNTLTYGQLVPLIQTHYRHVKHALGPIQGLCLKMRLPPLTAIVGLHLGDKRPALSAASERQVVTGVAALAITFRVGLPGPHWPIRHAINRLVGACHQNRPGA